MVIQVLHKIVYVCFGCLLESHRRGNSNIYPQHMILWRTGPALFSKNTCYLVYFKGFMGTEMFKDKQNTKEYKNLT